MSRIINLGYFLHRMRNSGYRTDVLYDRYGDMDPRAWSVVIDPGVASIFCTCYINREDLGDNFFELYDGGQFIPTRLILKTNSIDILVEYLVKYHVNNKAASYPDPKRLGKKKEGSGEERDK